MCLLKTLWLISPGLISLVSAGGLHYGGGRLSSRQAAGKLAESPQCSLS